MSHVARKRFFKVQAPDPRMVDPFVSSHCGHRMSVSWPVPLVFA